MRADLSHTGSGVLLWTARVLIFLVSLAFTGSALTKLFHVPKVIEGLTSAGIPDAAVVPIGVLELSLLILYLYKRTSVLGTFLLTGYIGGAIVTHIVGKQNIAPPLVVGVLMFAGSYLRHSRLRELVPLRPRSEFIDPNVKSTTTAAG